MEQKTVHVVGGGLAGSEAAWQCLKQGHKVFLYEMRPVKGTEAHKTGNLAELVCSNSMKSLLPHTAAGELKHEMKSFGSLIIEAAFENRVPAGMALAIEREGFSKYVEKKLNSFEKVVSPPHKKIPYFFCSCFNELDILDKFFCVNDFLFPLPDIK